jgi:hypothetical protein
VRHFAIDCQHKLRHSTKGVQRYVTYRTVALSNLFICRKVCGAPISAVMTTFVERLVAGLANEQDFLGHRNRHLGNSQLNTT